MQYLSFCVSYFTECHVLRVHPCRRVSASPSFFWLNTIPSSDWTTLRLSIIRRWTVEALAALGHGEHCCCEHRRAHVWSSPCWSGTAVWRGHLGPGHAIFCHICSFRFSSSHVEKNRKIPVKLVFVIHFISPHASKASSPYVTNIEGYQ